MKKLSAQLRALMDDAVLGLRSQPRPRGYIKLVDDPGYRIRVRTPEGPYRIIYDIDDQARSVTVLQIVARKNAY